MSIPHPTTDPRGVARATLLLATLAATTACKEGGPVGSGLLEFDLTELNFGDVPIGEEQTLEVTLTNGSNMDHMPATGQSGVDLYVGEPGKQRYCSTSRISPEALDYTVTLFRGSKANRNFTLNFPLYNGVKSLEIGVAAGSKVTAPPPFQQEGVIARGYGRIEIPDVGALRGWVAERSELSPVQTRPRQARA